MNSTESVTEPRYQWRVTRYDPALRGRSGAYEQETWTSITDVGRVFDGAVLTITEYERVESAYLTSFKSFAAESELSEIVIRELDFSDDPSLSDNATVSVSRAEVILRDLLREKASCRLEAVDPPFYTHVGFDLYMYIGSTRPCERSVALAVELGLFVEPDWPSPQLAEE